jgi:hypothetical protein
MNAANGGHLDVLRWALANGCPWHPRTCANAAARGGHLEVLKWMRANGHANQNIWHYCKLAARANQHWKVLAWLHENKA